MRNSRFDFTDPVPAAADLGRVHFIAIGGAGMSGVARVMLAQGVAVSGSDARESLVLTALATEGADVHVGHDAAHLEGADTVVISSAIREDNPELKAARERGLRVLHRSQALASVMQGRRRVAVAGANGKTTTTSMLTVALQHCGVDPSFAVGGELAKHGTNAHHGTGDVFVAEADESDGSFLVYRPEVAVVTNVQPDHLDFYGTFEAVQEAYARFAASIEPGGLLVTCADDEGARTLADAARAGGVRVLTYGVADDADLRLSDLAGEGMASSARLQLRGEDTTRTLQIGIPGRHNLLNAAAAWLAATEGLGQDPDLVLEGLAGFTGTRRRFEPKGEAGGVRVVDDYAHNPGKVAAVVETARGLAAPGRLVVVFQPHLYSRTRDFAGQLADALGPADVVLVMDVYAAREDPVPGVSGALVADRVTGADARFVPSWSAVAPAVAELARPGDLVLTVGAGDVTMVGPEVLRLLGERPQVPAAGA
ncbi:MAG: UDP-N-acetylmuramate--L-alanine ligase [Oryzihumus sp.]